MKVESKTEVTTTTRYTATLSKADLVTLLSGSVEQDMPRVGDIRFEHGTDELFWDGDAITATWEVSATEGDR